MTRSTAPFTKLAPREQRKHGSRNFFSATAPLQFEGRPLLLQEAGDGFLNACLILLSTLLIIASVIGVAMKAGLTAFTSTPCFAHVLDKPIARFRIAPFAAQ